jgi:hypothetical protein
VDPNPDMVWWRVTKQEAEWIRKHREDDKRREQIDKMGVHLHQLATQLIDQSPDGGMISVEYKPEQYAQIRFRFRPGPWVKEPENVYESVYNYDRTREAEHRDHTIQRMVREFAHRIFDQVLPEWGARR